MIPRPTSPDVEADEYTPLIGASCPDTNQSPLKNPSKDTVEEVSEVDGSIVWAVLPILLLGVFIAQADSSIVLATNQEIASGFGALSDSSWLITTYALAQCACQPLYGKTSDIFGRKPALGFSYVVFTLGCFLCGIGSKHWHVLVGRAISGVGGAGMVGLVAIILVDMLPPRQVAKWRGYVNVVATLGRSCGGPLGGWLVDNIGWRWCFLGQCPVAALAAILIAWKLPSNFNAEGSNLENVKVRQKLARVDFTGFALLPSALVVAFIGLDLAGKFYSYLYTGLLAAGAVILMLAFWYVEVYCAPEPIIPMGLLARSDVFIPFLLIALQTAAQFIITYTIPIYFQIVTGMSVAAAGSRIVFIVAGNAVGGLLSGWFISRTGRYKSLILAATIAGIICYALVLVRWHGASGLLDSSYLFLGGLGMGSTQSTTFVHLAVSLDPKDIAVAGTTWFLCQSAAMLVAANMFNMVYNVTLMNTLNSALTGIENKDEIIDGVTSSVEYIKTLPPILRAIITKVVVRSLIPTNAVAFGCGVLALITGLFIRERRLEKKQT